MAGRVPAIRSGTVLARMAGTDPAMTVELARWVTLSGTWYQIGILIIS